MSGEIHGDSLVTPEKALVTSTHTVSRFNTTWVATNDMRITALDQKYVTELKGQQNTKGKPLKKKLGYSLESIMTSWKYVPCEVKMLRYKATDKPYCTLKS